MNNPQIDSDFLELIGLDKVELYDIFLSSEDDDDFVNKLDIDECVNQFDFESREEPVILISENSCYAYECYKKFNEYYSRILA